MNNAIIDELKQGLVCHSAEQTRAAAAALADGLPAEAWLALHGDLGTGKTTFVTGIAQALQITQPVTSPTFAIFNIYQGSRQLIHVDAYRLQSGQEADDLLLDEWLSPPYCVAVEWPDRLGDTLPADAWHLHFSILTPGCHRIFLQS